MKKILLAALLLLSLIACVTTSSWAGGVDDALAGLAADAEGNLDKAIELYSKAIASGELSLENLSKAYYNRGNDWGKKGNFDKAIADLTRSVEINPKYADAYCNRGYAWYLKGDYDKAIADYTKAIEINPKHTIAYYQRGNGWDGKGDSDNAIADYTKAIEINPKHASAYGNRGNAWYRKGNYDKATADHTKAIEIDPGNALAYYNRAYAWWKKGNFDKAIADFTKAMEINPKFTDAYNDLAWLMATCPEGKYRDGKRAVELAERASKLEDTPNRLSTLAAAYAEAGRFQEAIKTQEMAITKLKQAGATEYLPQYTEPLSSYKAGKPWREK